MVGPMSSYSDLAMYMVLKVEREARMEPPIHTEYLRSLGATILTFMAAGAKEEISLDIRSAMPSYMVVPPDSTMLAYEPVDAMPVAQ